MRPLRDSSEDSPPACSSAQATLSGGTEACSCRTVLRRRDGGSILRAPGRRWSFSCQSQEWVTRCATARRSPTPMWRPYPRRQGLVLEHHADFRPLRVRSTAMPAAVVPSGLFQILKEKARRQWPALAKPWKGLPHSTRSSCFVCEPHLFRTAPRGEGSRLRASFPMSLVRRMSQRTVRNRGLGDFGSERRLAEPRPTSWPARRHQMRSIRFPLP